MDQATRRAALRTALATALGATVPVHDEATAAISDERFVVVSWLSTTVDRTQAVHTFTIECVATDADRFATRDAICRTVMVTTNALEGFGRPSATTGLVTIGGQDYDRMAVVTITATDDPIST